MDSHDLDSHEAYTGSGIPIPGKTNFKKSGVEHGISSTTKTIDGKYTSFFKIDGKSGKIFFPYTRWYGSVVKHITYSDHNKDYG
jgi:hypothetical protein